MTIAAARVLAAAFSFYRCSISHVMPTLACALAGICGCDLLFPSFPLDRKGPKGQGRHHGPTTLGNRPSPMSAGPARPARSVFGVPTHGIRARNPFSWLRTRVASRHREARSDPFMTDLCKI